MRFRFTQQQIEFLRQQYPLLSLEDLTVSFNQHFDCRVTKPQIHRATKNHKIRCGRTTPAVLFIKLLTQEQEQFLREQYKSLSRHQVTAALNERFGLSLRTSQIVSYCKNHGIRCGRTGQFEPGLVPFNAGTKGLMKANRTSFAPGIVPHTYVPVGSTTVDTEGYHKIKVGDPNVWEYIHRRNWEAAHGPIPKTHVVVFIDGNRDNTALENLELVSRAELGVRNKFKVSSLPPELRPLGKTLAKVRLKTGEVRRSIAR